MINLEELNLFLLVTRVDSTFIDGIQLHDQFLIYMTQLKKFTFNIKTEIRHWNVVVELPSNEYIQRSFIGRGYQQVASYVHASSITTLDTCHMYSLPFDFEYFIDLDNSFQGGMFHKVRYLKMNDRYPFEYKLIKLISQDLPFLQFLYINNSCEQKKKEDSSGLITFPYLTFLDLQDACVDYAQLFLLKTKMHLPRLLNLCIEYRSLRSITNNFTNDASYFNFETLKNLEVCEPFVVPKNFHRYFPSL